MEHSKHYGRRVRFSAATAVEEQLRANAGVLGLEVVECNWNRGMGTEYTDLHQLNLRIDRHVLTIYFTDQQLLEYLDGRGKEEIDRRIHAVLDELSELDLLLLGGATATSAEADTGLDLAGRRKKLLRKLCH